MRNTSPSRYALRLALVISAFAVAFAVIAIPRLKAETPAAPIAPIDRSMDKSLPPTLLNAEDEPRFQAAIECFKHDNFRKIKECMEQALK